MTVTVHGTYGRLDHGTNHGRKSIFHRDRARIWRVFLPDSNREQAKDKSRQVNRERAVLAFQYRKSSGAGQVGFLFFLLSSAFLRLPLSPIGLSDLCSHRRKNKTQVALSGHHRDHGTWSTRCCRYLPPIEDTYFVGPEREKSLLSLRTTGYHLAEIVSCLSCHVGVASWRQI